VGFFSGILTGLGARIKFDKTLLLSGRSICRNGRRVNGIIPDGGRGDKPLIWLKNRVHTERDNAVFFIDPYGTASAVDDGGFSF